MIPKSQKYVRSLMESIVVNSTKKLSQVIEASKRSGRYVVYECIYDDYNGHRHYRIFYWRERIC